MVSNNREQLLFHAVTFDNNRSTAAVSSPLSRTSASEPLLGHYHDEESNDEDYANDFNIIRQKTSPSGTLSTCSQGNNPDDAIIFRRLKLATLAIGMMVGIVIQFSTLGVNFLVMNQWGGGVDDDVLSSKSSLQQKQQVALIFSLVWSIITSAVAIFILACLRKLVQKSYFSTLEKKTPDAILEEMMLQLECRFVVGALIGVCTAWSITDALMGMSKQIILSLVILAFALAWCRIIMSFLAVSSNDPPSSSRYPACHRRTTTRSILTPTTSEIPIV